MPTVSGVVLPVGASLAFQLTRPAVSTACALSDMDLCEACTHTSDAPTTLGHQMHTCLHPLCVCSCRFAQGQRKGFYTRLHILNQHGLLQLWWGAVRHWQHPPVGEP